MFKNERENSNHKTFKTYLENKERETFIES